MVTKVKANKIMAINGIATTIEQSKKLIELGINIDTADMTWEKVAKSLTEDFYWKLTVGLDSAIKGNLFSYRNGHVTPAWSLSALIELMPIKIRNSKQFTLYKGESGYSLTYFFHDEDYPIIKDDVTLLDTAFEMVCYLLENKLI